MAGIEGGRRGPESGGTWARGNEVGQHRMAVQGMADQIKEQATKGNKTVFEVLAELNWAFGLKYEVLQVLFRDVHEIVHKRGGERILKGNIKRIGFNETNVELTLEDGTVIIDGIDQFLLE